MSPHHVFETCPVTLRDEQSSECSLGAYRDFLRRLAKEQLGSRLNGKLDASDAAQQALLQAHAARSQYRGRRDGERRAWLRSILGNVLAAAHRHFEARTRSIARERSIDQDSARADGVQRLIPDEQSSPSQRVIRAENLAQLTLALSQLPDDQRRVIEAHHLRGMTVAEVALEMGRSPSAVVGLLFRGLQRLRTLFPRSGSEAD